MPTQFFRDVSVAFMHTYNCYPEEQGATTTRSLNSALRLHQTPRVPAEAGSSNSKHLEKVFTSFCHALAFLERLVFLSARLREITLLARV